MGNRRNGESFIAASAWSKYGVLQIGAFLPTYGVQASQGNPYLFWPFSDLQNSSNHQPSEVISP